MKKLLKLLSLLLVCMAVPVTFFLTGCTPKGSGGGTGGEIGGTTGGGTDNGGTGGNNNQGGNNNGGTDTNKFNQAVAKEWYGVLNCIGPYNEDPDPESVFTLKLNDDWTYSLTTDYTGDISNYKNFPSFGTGTFTYDGLKPLDYDGTDTGEVGDAMWFTFTSSTGTTFPIWLIAVSEGDNGDAIYGGKEYTNDDFGLFFVWDLDEGYLCLVDDVEIWTN